jgi:hypothetical protein
MIYHFFSCMKYFWFIFRLFKQIYACSVFNPRLSFQKPPDGFLHLSSPKQIFDTYNKSVKRIFHIRQIFWALKRFSKSSIQLGTIINLSQPTQPTQTKQTNQKTKPNPKNQTPKRSSAKKTLTTTNKQKTNPTQNPPTNTNQTPTNQKTPKKNFNTSQFTEENPKQTIKRFIRLLRSMCLCSLKIFRPLFRSWNNQHRRNMQV